MTDATYQCMYCTAVIEEARLPRDYRPGLRDEIGWLRLAELHKIGCDWVHHRGHQRQTTKGPRVLKEGR